jgi:DNA repair protein SbcC/Rad50
MRPHLVVMQAFGPYAHRQKVDFSKLAGRSFFLIHGPTGAGKTTILDAMTFALFGVTSGDERRADDMRSHHASTDTLTTVEFEFSIGVQHYLIHRSPEQQRPKRRGTGFAVQDKEATLWRLTDEAAGALAPTDAGALSAEGGEARGGRSVLAFGWSRVTEKCEELLGFKAAQFRQVVLLPQGRFQELLRSESKQRQEILETLFQTQIYRRIEEALKAHAKGAEELIKDKRRRREVFLEQAGVSSEDELRERKEQLVAQLDQAFSAKLTCDQAEKGARLVCDRAKDGNDKLDKLAEATEDGKAIEARAAQSDEARRELKWARRAEQLAGPQRLVEERQADLRLAEERLSQAQAASVAADEEYERARSALQEQESEPRAAERTRLDEEVRRLTGMLTKAADLAEAQEQQAVAAEALRAAEDQTRIAAEAADAAAAAESKAQEALRAAQQLAERLPELTAMADRSAELARARERLEDGEVGLAAAERRVAEATAALQHAEAEHRQAAQAAADLERSWADGQAALLAAELRPGAPCPVCGSTKHPAPAHAERRVPGQPEVEAARTAATEAFQTLRAADRALLDLRKEAAERQATLTSCRDTLGEAAMRASDELAADAKAAQQQCATAAAATAALADLHAEAERAALAAAQAAAGSKTAGTGQTAVRTNADKAEALVNERAACLPEELRTTETLQTALEEARHRSGAAQSVFERVQEEEHAAAKAQTDAAAELSAAKKTIADSRTKLASAQVSFGELVDELGFADELAYGAAQRTSDQAATLEAIIRDYDDERVAAADRLDRAAAAAQGLERTDLAPLLQALSAAEEAANQAIAVASGLQEQLNQCDQWIEALSKVTDELAEHEATYAVIGRLSQVANGDNQLRLSFQRFVLGAWLDDVLVAATRRLAIMSRGRYILQRADEPRDNRKAAGLDLSVLDEWTGMQRPVSTLSGGETFLASLSLALGLAEVVQAYAGGIHLDTVFVDEGFGSLDEEALAAALEALTGLQQGGRLVGIISHVSELQEQIDARLQITAGRTGSSARFVVP